MPRPTVAQLAYGSCTVILSTLSMLLLSQTSSVVGVALVALSALALGLLVSMTVPVRKPAPAAAAAAIPTPAAEAAGSAGVSDIPKERVPVQREAVSASFAAEPVREPAER
ncbi:hypothetical protein [Streptomyces sp. NPDC002845]